ncbi:MAG: hypothetical protein IAI50_14380 [Candidatus Eremiobacteraeota bacterium]|nr:hypothetical protein [Candidatus Eremiobacteraeota bacterium]
MKEDRPPEERDSVASLANGIRLDLVIAVCALLISTLATGASWWQARVLQAQTEVLQQQLGAQVWPYVNVSVGTDGNQIKISIINDGLGPAVLRSESGTVDGIPQANFIDMMHAVLGPNIIARKPRGEKLSITLSANSPGSVLRPGDSVEAFTLTSKHYAPLLLRAFGRLNFHTCYCAIIPGKCWLSDAASTRDPQPVAVCREDLHDLFHAPVVDELLNHTY